MAKSLNWLIRAYRAGKAALRKQKIIPNQNFGTSLETTSTIEDAMMGPSPPKRRKLDSASSDMSEAEENVPIEELAPVASAKKAPASKSNHTMRTQEEDDAALYAGGLYRSSLFKLQVDELLREVLPNYEKRFSGVSEALHKLRGLIEGIEEREALSVSYML